MPGMADQLRFLPTSDRNLGPCKGVWCDFHQTFGHDVEQVRRGSLNEAHEDEAAPP